MAERDQFTLDLSCPHCGARGAVVWEENSKAVPKGPQRRLVFIDGKFHQEAGRSNSGDPLIICDVCDQILPD
jgi:hypothetical protein